ncbi:MAG: hypothetical protein HQ514_07095 [Rhodospirillales bacterium]|nr:hypothetical protein [Rhodospirillales bacterium]
MSNPLYEQVKVKVEASSLAQGQPGSNPLDWHDDVLKAERLRSLAVAAAFGKLFSKCFSAFSGFGGTVDRAYTANRLSTLDESSLTKTGFKRTDLPGYVAGYVESAQNSIKLFEARHNAKKAA